MYVKTKYYCKTFKKREIFLLGIFFLTIFLSQVFFYNLLTNIKKNPLELVSTDGDNSNSSQTTNSVSSLSNQTANPVNQEKEYIFQGSFSNNTIYSIIFIISLLGSFLFSFSVIVKPNPISEVILSKEYKKIVDVESNEEIMVSNNKFGKLTVKWDSTTGLPRNWLINIKFEPDITRKNDFILKKYIDSIIMAKIKSEKTEELGYEKKIRASQWSQIEYLLNYWYKFYSTTN
jgi:hypothetical protein